MGGGCEGVGVLGGLVVAVAAVGLAAKLSATLGALEDGVAVDATEGGAVHAKSALFLALLAFAPFAAGALVVGGWGHGCMVAFSRLFLQEGEVGGGVD